MRLHRLGLELRMELAAEEPGMLHDLADLHVNAVGSFARDAKARGFELLFVLAIELVAVAMAFVNLTGAIGARGEAIGMEMARPTSQAHRAAEIVDAFELAQLENHAMRRAG